MPLIRTLKDTAKSVPLLGPLAHRWWASYNLWKFHPTQMIQRRLGGKKAVQVVEIGANDGKANDPIHPLLDRNTQWKALFVEPVPYLFARLKQNYGPDPRFRFENVAITETAKSMNFYYVSERAKAALPALPPWHGELGSFNREHIHKLLPEFEIDPFIDSAEVQCLPLQVMLDRNDIRSIDLLHIDTEGHDWLILRQLDLSRYQPTVIFFEHVHLDAQQKAAARQFLAPHYEVIELGNDWLCSRLK
ncbi:MAG TPA: FkbM family methyltransferase [Tepidisphaeraceae bacterium]|jgi:FkbM family methyltransferase|nr:FkbM family methyltransferase [Tepidisphaeraceae bacterium]